MNSKTILLSWLALLFLCSCQNNRKTKICKLSTHIFFRAPYVYPGETIALRQQDTILKQTSSNQEKPSQLEFEANVCRSADDFNLRVFSSSLDTVYEIKHHNHDTLFINLSLPYPKKFAGKKLTLDQLNYGYLPPDQATREIIVEHKRTGIAY